MNVLIGLLACNYPLSETRRTLCRQTWMPSLLDAGVDVVFLMGGYERLERCGDELHLPVADGYKELPQKTKAFMQWALDTSGATHVFKADDDTLIASPRFMGWVAEVESHPYVGNQPFPRGKPYASGGAGYLLSMTAVECIVKAQWPRRGYEDVLTGVTMRQNRIPFHVDFRLIPWGNDSARPLPDNYIVTSHKLAEDLWRDSWEKIGARSEVARII